MTFIEISFAELTAKIHIHCMRLNVHTPSKLKLFTKSQSSSGFRLRSSLNAEKTSLTMKTLTETKRGQGLYLYYFILIFCLMFEISSSLNLTDLIRAKRADSLLIKKTCLDSPASSGASPLLFEVSLSTHLKNSSPHEFTILCMDVRMSVRV